MLGAASPADKIKRRSLPMILRLVIPFLKKGGVSANLKGMTTLNEIENAVARLPRGQQRKLHTSLTKRLTSRVKPPASLHDLAKDLCGSVASGVGDLSDKKKHLRLKGYGKK